ncbi:odorant receptor 131-2-like [Betta splendens]|uniref:Odorant receptor 131-2-like n=1 Tax=Betta splendens TaxID=158456 RepID=A0A6P7P5G6_BETSP|nr:odorant receptor 131-2-like [Betta splendens]
MTNNSSLSGGDLVPRRITIQVIIVQVLVIIFLVINFTLIVTFFKNENFITTTRYILFALTLLSDSLILIMTNVLLLLSFFQITMQVWLCVIISVLVYPYYNITPVTLTAMTLERYVAVCMPLHHGELCSMRSTVHCILIIHGLSAIPCVIIFCMFFATASLSSYTEDRICSEEMFILYKWQDHVRSSVQQAFFFIIFIIIVFCYFKIMKAARAASGELKKLTNKGLRTVVLHGFQLMLCLTSLWCPLIETAVLQISFKLFIDVRYFNYIMFSLSPRCLSPLIYGVRDEQFFFVVKHYILSGFRNRNI